MCKMLNWRILLGFFFILYKLDQNIEMIELKKKKKTVKCGQMNFAINRKIMFDNGYLNYDVRSHHPHHHHHHHFKSESNDHIKWHEINSQIKNLHFIQFGFEFQKWMKPFYIISFHFSMWSFPWTKFLFHVFFFRNPNLMSIFTLI